MSYKTVAGSAQITYIVNKSRFIGHCERVESEQQALEALAKLRKEYSDASHNCFAYKVRENNIGRYSDDGEPGGTAGMPIMEVINAKDLTDVLVVVTRYFGGVLLGAGGLVRAYSKTAAQVLDSAKTARFGLAAGYEIKLPYAWFDRLMNIFKVMELEAEDQVFAENVSLRVFVADDSCREFEMKLDETFEGKIEAVKTESIYKLLRGE